jgi:uncharacterized protein
MKSKLIKTVVVVIVLAIIENFLNDILRLFPAYVNLPKEVKPVFWALPVILAFAGIYIVHRVSILQAIRMLGLKMPIFRALIFAFIATLPMSIGFALTSKISKEISFKSIFLLALFAPFIEELFYRGYVFRQLFRYAKWRFSLAIIVPSLIFALGHWYQATDWLELLGISLITGLGSIVFCWVFMKWQDNLWAAFGIHFFMNLWWEVFAVDENSLGDWFANAMRFASVFLVIILTIYKDKIWKPLQIEKENVAEFAKDNEVNPAFREKDWSVPN